MVESVSNEVKAIAEESLAKTVEKTAAIAPADICGTRSQNSAVLQPKSSSAVVSPKINAVACDLLYAKTIALLIAVLVVVVTVILKGSDGQAVTFKPFDGATFTGALAGLIAVALFIERAIEVLVAVVRDRQADDLQSSQQSAQSELDAATAAWQAAQGTSGQTLALESMRQKQVSLDAFTANLTAYKAGTKEFAMKAALAIAALVSLVGVRSLQTLIEPGYQIRGSFTLADVIVTSLLLAGGSEGIHRIANVFTSFMDGASSRIDANTSAQQAASKGNA